jgi:hypothetical protein
MSPDRLASFDRLALKYPAECAGLIAIFWRVQLLQHAMENSWHFPPLSGSGRPARGCTVCPRWNIFLNNIRFRQIVPATIIWPHIDTKYCVITPRVYLSTIPMEYTPDKPFGIRLQYDVS